MVKCGFVDKLIVSKQVIHRHNRLETIGILVFGKAVCGHQRQMNRFLAGSVFNEALHLSAKFGIVIHVDGKLVGNSEDAVR